MIMKKKTIHTIVIGLIFLSVTALGTQQEIQMKAEIARVVQIKTLMTKPSVPMPEKINFPSTFEYRRVTLAGQFLHDHKFLIHSKRTLGGVSGYHMLVPFQRASGGIVMVNRGWISNTEIPKAYHPKGTIMIEGIVQLPRENSSMPPNDPSKNIWYWADVNAMATAGKLKTPSPVVIIISSKTSGVYPSSGVVEIKIRSDYGVRAVFWYVLALSLLIGFLIRHQSQKPKLSF